MKKLLCTLSILLWGTGIFASPDILNLAIGLRIDNQPVLGERTITVQLVEGDDVIWSEDHFNVWFHNGQTKLRLGSSGGKYITEDMLNRENIKVRFKMDGEELDTLFGGTAYAFVAKRAEKADSADSVLSSKIVGLINGNQIADNSITDSKIISISADKIVNFSSVNLNTFSGDLTGVKEMKIENLGNNNGSGSRINLKGSNGANTAEFAVLKDASSGINTVHLRSLSSSNDLFVGINDTNYIQLDASEKRLIVPVDAQFNGAVAFVGGFDLGSDISAVENSINNNTKATLSAKADGGTGVVTALSSLKDDLGSTFGTVGTTTDDDFKVQRNNIPFFTMKKDGSDSIIEFETGVRIRGGTFENTSINPSSMSGAFPDITGVGTLNTLSVGTDIVLPWQTAFDVVQMDTLSVFSKDSVGGLSFNWYVNSLGSTLYGTGNNSFASSLEFNKADGLLNYKVTPVHEDGGAVVASMPTVFSINQVGDSIFSGTINAPLATFSGSVTADSFTGSGQNISDINADNVVSGTISNDRFNSLSDLGGGSGNTFLRKDGSWANPQPSESSIEEYISNDISTGYLARDNGTKLVTSVIYEKSDGNIGIGNSDPREKLDVRGGNIILGTYELGGQIDFGTGWNDLVIANGNGMSMHSGNNVNIYLDSNANNPDTYFAVSNHGISGTVSEIFRILEGGNVGIGTDQPLYKLHVKNGDIALGTNGVSASIFFNTGWNDSIVANGGGYTYNSGANHRFVLDVNKNQSQTYLSIENQLEGSTSVVFVVSEDGDVTATGAGEFKSLTVTDGNNDGGNLALKPVNSSGVTVVNYQRPKILEFTGKNLDSGSTFVFNTLLSQDSKLLNVDIQIKDNSGNMYPVDYKTSFGYVSASSQKIQVYTEGTEQPDGFRTLDISNAESATWKTEISGPNHAVALLIRSGGFFDSASFNNATVIIKVEWAN